MQIGTRMNLTSFVLLLAVLVHREGAQHHVAGSSMPVHDEPAPH